MALSVPSFENPFDPNSPFVSAYAWTAGLGLDLAAGQGRLTVNVHPNEGAWQAPPIGQVTINLGEVLIPASQDENGNPVPEVRVKSLVELLSDQDFASAYQVIGSKLYLEALKHPKFQGSSIV